MKTKTGIAWRRIASDGLPDDDVRVLFAAGDEVEVGHHDSGIGGWMNTEASIWDDADVYAWAHIPAPPDI